MPQQSQKRSLILASSSVYRKMLLQRLGIPFAVHSPEIDETSRAEEQPTRLVQRLAAAKADAIASLYPAAVVIGSDQVAVHVSRVLGKPGTLERACQQLASFSGGRVDFHTAVAVRCVELGLKFDTSVPTEACFRDLTEAEIQRYVERDRPVDCAGGFKSEETGMTLLQALRSDDPTAIVGLPLIRVSEALRLAGYELP